MDNCLCEIIQSDAFLFESWSSVGNKVSQCVLLIILAMKWSGCVVSINYELPFEMLGTTSLGLCTHTLKY